MKTKRFEPALSHDQSPACHGLKSKTSTHRETSRDQRRNRHASPCADPAVCMHAGWFRSRHARGLWPRTHENQSSLRSWGQPCARCFPAVPVRRHARGYGSVHCVSPSPCVPVTMRARVPPGGRPARAVLSSPASHAQRRPSESARARPTLLLSSGFAPPYLVWSTPPTRGPSRLRWQFAGASWTGLVESMTVCMHMYYKKFIQVPHTSCTDSNNACDVQ